MSIGVHKTHCCKWHGCKYGNKDCPVVNGVEKQLYLCEECYEDLDHEEYYNSVLKTIEEIKAFKDHPTEKVCTGKRCPMQVGYDVVNCKDKECMYRTETEKGGVE